MENPAFLKKAVNEKLLEDSQPLPIWLRGQVQKFLGFEDVEQIVDHMLSIESDDALRAYISDCFGSTGQVKRFTEALFAKRKNFAPIRKVAIPDDVQVYRKEGKDTNIIVGKKKKKKGGAVPGPEASSSEGAHAPATSSSSSSPSAPSMQQIQPPETTAKEGDRKKPKVKLPEMCDCLATQHSLVTNCLHCGKILCEMEGGSVCTFCGESTGLKGRKPMQPPSEELQKAVEHKNTLLNYANTSAQRTVVWDDQADYYALSNWSSPEERERIRKQEERARAAKEKSKRSTKLVFDFAGRKIVASEDSDEFNFEAFLPKPSEEIRPNINPSLSMPPPQFTPASSSAFSASSAKGNKKQKGGKTNAAPPPSAPQPVPVGVRASKRLQYDFYAIDEEQEHAETPKPFTYRGIVEGATGKFWTQQERESVVELLQQKQGNQYIFVVRHGEDWRLPLSDEVLGHLEHAVHLCAANKGQQIQVNFGISFAENFNPGSTDHVSSVRQQFEAVAKKFKLAHYSFHFDRFRVLSEDLAKRFSSLASAQASVINTLINALRGALGNEIQFYLYPTHSHGNVLNKASVGKNQIEYWKEISRLLEPSLAMYFNGPYVVSDHITTQFFEKLRSTCKNRRIILWDHFPSDESKLLSIRPYEGREKTLHRTLLGVVLNPRSAAVEGALFSLFSALEYTFDPEHYDPDKSLRAAVKTFVQDERITEDIMFLISFLDRPVSATGSGTVWARKVNTLAFFQDLQQRITHIRRASISDLVQRILQPFLDFVTAFCEKQAEALQKQQQ